MWGKSSYHSIGIFPTVFCTYKCRKIMQEFQQNESMASHALTSSVEVSLSYTGSISGHISRNCPLGPMTTSSSSSLTNEIFVQYGIKTLTSSLKTSYTPQIHYSLLQSRLPLH